MNGLLLLALVLAAIPAVLFLINLSAYRPAPPVNPNLPPRESEAISVLIPARNEAATIHACLRAVLQQTSHPLEVVVLDDHSTDTTADIVNQFSSHDPRVRLVSGASLPPGWCGKQHACWQLAHLARHPNLLFLDADVRLEPDAISRLAALVRQRPEVDLWSGVPRQITGSPLERLLIPLIHFVLLGFLPIPWARRSRSPAFGAGCGQLFLARRSAYLACQGHQAIRTSLHDGVKLPRLFRSSGFRTDLLDTTDLAVCRMYHNARQVWSGLGKNAIEGLAHPAAIGPWTLLLLGGHVLPLVLTIATFTLPLPEHRTLALASLALALAPRLLAVTRFRQPWLGALLHPIGVALLVTIQWAALVRHFRGRPSEWRGRSYSAAHPAAPSAPRVAHGRLGSLLLAFSLLAATLGGPGTEAAQPDRVPTFTLPDQFGTNHTVSFPRHRPAILLLGDRRGSEEVDTWIPHLKNHGGTAADLLGIADVSAAPRFLRSRIRDAIRKQRPLPLMLDFEGTVTATLGSRPKSANLLVIATNGLVVLRLVGPPDESKLRAIRESLLPHPQLHSASPSPSQPDRPPPPAVSPSPAATSLAR